MEHLDSVQGEDPDVASHMTKADQVKGPVEKPDPVGVHFSPGLFPAAHGEIDDLNRFPFDGRIIYLLQDFLEFAVVFVRFHSKVKGLLDIFQIFDRFGGQGGLDFREKGFQGVIENGPSGFSVGNITKFLCPHAFNRSDGHLYGHQAEKGLNQKMVSPCIYWRAQQDSNLRPTDS